MALFWPKITPLEKKKGEILSKHALENILYCGPPPEKSINVDKCVRLSEDFCRYDVVLKV